MCRTERGSDPLGDPIPNRERDGGTRVILCIAQRGSRGAHGDPLGLLASTEHRRRAPQPRGPRRSVRRDAQLAQRANHRAVYAASRRLVEGGELGSSALKGLGRWRGGLGEGQHLLGSAHGWPTAGRIVATSSVRSAAAGRSRTAVSIAAQAWAPSTGETSRSTFASNSSSLSGRSRLPRACGMYAVTGSAPPWLTRILAASLGQSAAGRRVISSRSLAISGARARSSPNCANPACPSNNPTAIEW